MPKTIYLVDLSFDGERLRVFEYTEATVAAVEKYRQLERTWNEANDDTDLIDFDDFMLAEGIDGYAIEREVSR